MNKVNVRTNLTSPQLIILFLQGDTSGATNGGFGNLKIIGDQLIHYDTVIAERYNGNILLNVSRYSPQTSKIQTTLRESIPHKKLIEVSMVPKNYAATLSKLVKT